MAGAFLLRALQSKTQSTLQVGIQERITASAAAPSGRAQGLQTPLIRIYAKLDDAACQNFQVNNKFKKPLTQYK